MKINLKFIIIILLLIISPVFETSPLSTEFTCPKCKFSGSQAFFPAIFTKEEKKELFKILEAYKEKEIDTLNESEIMEKIYTYLKVNSKELANTYLVGSYILRGQEQRYKYDNINKSNKDYIITFQKKAISYFNKAIDENKVYDKDIAVTYYLIAELYRRTNDFDKSIKYFDLALNSKIKPSWLDKLAKE